MDNYPSIMLYTVCWTVLLSSVGCVALDGPSNKHIEYNVCRHSENEVWFYDITNVACLDECQTRQGCVSVNFHEGTQSCFLNMDTPDEKETCRDFVITEKSANNMALSPECMAAQCLMTQVCVYRSTGITCEYRECPNPPTVLNGQILGNQRYVGARISVMCNYNYVLVGPMSMTCRNDGVWLGGPAGELASPECRQKSCVVNPPEAYTVHPEYATFHDAATVCEMEGRHLVSFGCEEEYNFVVALMQDHSLKSIFIGLNDLDVTHQWAWFNSPDEVNYIPWLPGEPNFIHEHCGVISQWNGINDVPCSLFLPFICEAD